VADSTKPTQTNAHQAKAQTGSDQASEERIVIVVEPGAAALRERIQADYKQAMLARDRVAISTLRLLRAAIQTLEVARTDEKREDFGRPLTEADVVGVVEKQIKQREESAGFFDKAGRADGAAAERAEAAVLQRYLPTRLGRGEIAVVVERLVGELGRDFRKVMPAAAKELKGKADGRLVQEVVKEITGG
jgi:uncharacterized protein YqeY